MFVSAVQHIVSRRAAHAFCHISRGIMTISHISNQQININDDPNIFISVSPIIAYPSIKSSLNEEANNGCTDKDFEPTWKYVPYQPPPTRKPRRKSNGTVRREFSTSTWTVPDNIRIPEDQLQISFARASGAGGQNVNKVNTKVELRFHLDTASWIPREVRDRLKTNETNRINNEGYFVITCQENRTQVQNRKEAIKKLQDILKSSWERPKVRKLRKGLTKKAKENRRENKKRISQKKENRRRVDF